MTLFLALAALLTLAAVLFVALPLLRGGRRAVAVPHEAANIAIYQDQLAELSADLDAGTLSEEQFEKARLELERRLLADVAAQGGDRPVRHARWPGLAAALALPLAAALLYWQLGNPAAITAPKLAGLTPAQQVEALLPTLERHLARQPEDATGWRMLAKGYMALERYADAAAALDRAARLLPQDPQVLADYADALAMSQGQRLAGRPAELIARALELDPDHPKALYLAGFAALERGDTKEAAKHWKRLLSRLPPDSEDAQAVREQLAEVERQPRSSAAAITGSVRLAPALKDRVSPNDTVFVFARPVDGPRMPLAILRLSARDLPASFRLDDSLAMGPQTKLSAFPEVVVGARVSKSGNAAPTAGDLEGLSGPVKPGTREVTVVIDRVIE